MSLIFRNAYIFQAKNTPEVQALRLGAAGDSEPGGLGDVARNLLLTGAAEARLWATRLVRGARLARET